MQNLTPLEIQKQTFSRAIKGYTVDEVRGYLHLVAEEIDDHSQRERILKDTLLSAQKVSEDVRANARKEAELIVKDAELLSDRLISQAQSRVADLERAIQELKMERRAARNKLQTMLDTTQQLLMLDAEREANEEPITSLFRKSE